MDISITHGRHAACVGVRWGALCGLGWERQATHLTHTLAPTARCTKARLTTRRIRAVGRRHLSSARISVENYVYTLSASCRQPMRLSPVGFCERMTSLAALLSVWCGLPGAA